MLRRALLIVGGLLLLAALVLFTHPPLLGIALYLAFYGILVVGGILFERSAYRPRIQRSHAGWQRTGERFTDPVSGALTEVWFNPETGERDYRSV